MFCSNCGKQIKDSAKFCPHCGKAQAGPNAADSYSGQNVPNNPYTWNNQGGTNAGGPVITSEQYPMKWFKFVIYVQLFVNAFVNVITAVTYFTGSVYNSYTNISAKWIYTYYPGLKTANYLYAICLLGLAVMAIVVRMKLANYQKNSPIIYIKFIIISSCVGLFYVVLAGIITKSWSGIPIQIGTVIGMAIYAALNWSYFSKRSALFTN